MRDRLIELIKRDNCRNPFTCSPQCKYVESDDCHSERLADLILADGWMRPPCKVGDTVYFIQSKQIFEGRVILIRPFIHKDYTNFHGNVLYECINPFYDDGRTMEHQISVVFKEYGENTIAYLTREEAEVKLRKEQNNER